MPAQDIRVAQGSARKAPARVADAVPLTNPGITPRPNLPSPRLQCLQSSRTSLLQRMQRQHHVRGRADWRTCMPSHAPHSPPAWIDQLTAPPAPTTACRVHEARIDRHRKHEPSKGLISKKTCRARPRPAPFAQQHLKLHGPPNSGRSVALAEWDPSLKKATDACVLASNNASPAQRGPRRDAQPPHATPLAAVLFPARGATSYLDP